MPSGGWGRSCLAPVPERPQKPPEDTLLRRGGAVGREEPGLWAGPAPPPPSPRRAVGALPSPGSPPFRARERGRSWARSIVERRGEARGSRAEPRRPRLPPGRRGCTWPAPQPGCGGRPERAGSAASPGTCALAQTARYHEPDRPRLLLHAQLLRKCLPSLRWRGSPEPRRRLHPQPRPGPALEIPNFSPSPFPRALAGKGDVTPFLYWTCFHLWVPRIAEGRGWEFCDPSWPRSRCP